MIVSVRAPAMSPRPLVSGASASRPAVVVRADEQVVDRRPGRTVLGLAEGVAAELDPGDVAELVVEVGERAGGAERADDADDVEDDEEPLRPRPVGVRGCRHGVRR